MKAFWRRLQRVEQPSTVLADDYQPHRLVDAMHGVGLRHGDTARVDVNHVRVGIATSAGLIPGGLFFCEIGPLKVNEVVTIGDGGSLPDEVALDGLRGLQVGYYDLKNALITSNGTVQLTIDEHTEVMAAEPVA